MVFNGLISEVAKLRKILLSKTAPEISLETIRPDHDRIEIIKKEDPGKFRSPLQSGRPPPFFHLFNVLRPC